MNPVCCTLEIIYTQDDVAPIITSFDRNALDLGVVLSSVDDPRPYGVAVLDADGKMIDIVEKPVHPPSNLVVTGIYYFSPAVFPVIENLNPSGRGEYEISDTIHMMLTDPQIRFSSAEIGGWWDDTGTADAILIANHKILSRLISKNLGIIEDNVRIIGQVQIGNNSRIKSGTMIRGPVIIGDDCIIGPGYLGPYTAIGSRCTVTGGEIESSILVSDASVCLHSTDRIIDSLIGKHTRITSSSHKCPSGTKLIIGENSEVFL